MATTAVPSHRLSRFTRYPKDTPNRPGWKTMGDAINYKWCKKKRNLKLDVIEALLKEEQSMKKQAQLERKKEERELISSY